jgi:hypothetical protein
VLQILVRVLNSSPNVVQVSAESPKTVSPSSSASVRAAWSCMRWLSIGRPRSCSAGVDGQGPRDGHHRAEDGVVAA